MILKLYMVAQINGVFFSSRFVYNFIAYIFNQVWYLIKWLVDYTYPSKTSSILPQIISRTRSK